jgi:hypothetical protein
MAWRLIGLQLLDMGNPISGNQSLAVLNQVPVQMQIARGALLVQIARI